MSAKLVGSEPTMAMIRDGVTDVEWLRSQLNKLRTEASRGSVPSAVAFALTDPIMDRIERVRAPNFYPCCGFRAGGEHNSSCTFYECDAAPDADAARVADGRASAETVAKRIVNAIPNYPGWGNLDESSREAAIAAVRTEFGAAVSHTSGCLHLESDAKDERIATLETDLANARQRIERALKVLDQWHLGPTCAAARHALRGDSDVG